MAGVCGISAPHYSRGPPLITSSRENETSFKQPPAIPCPMRVVLNSGEQVPVKDLWGGTPALVNAESEEPFAYETSTTLRRWISGCNIEQTNGLARRTSYLPNRVTPPPAHGTNSQWDHRLRLVPSCSRRRTRFRRAQLAG